uniref:Transmembrane protein 98 n=1 Tax=Dermatophagoides pteronyssinus TaxID=6956 RepID=A0A6P6Y4V9_DERPT|nr:transmembrane protein 98-like [Dermatophagoides pteronyssinus]
MVVNIVKTSTRQPKSFKQTNKHQTATTMDEVETIENIVVIAIIILLVVFAGSLLTLIIICYQRNNHLLIGGGGGGNKGDFLFRSSKSSSSSSSFHHFNNDDDTRFSGQDHTHLISSNGGGLITDIKRMGKKNQTTTNMELDDVRLHPNIDQILSNTQWVDDATGLIPHCLALLKGCHHLTERLVSSTMSAMPRFTENEQRMKLFEIGRIAPTISARVDDVVEAMYPPLDPRLLESRCLSLLLSVSRLAIVIVYTCAIRGKWIDDELKGLELQLKILHEVGQTLLINGDDNNPETINSTAGLNKITNPG